MHEKLIVSRVKLIFLVAKALTWSLSRILDTFHPEIYLTPISTMEYVNALLNALRVHFSSVDTLAIEPQRVHMKACTHMGIELNILLYIKTTNFDVYLDEINTLNLVILSMIEQHQCKLQVVGDRVLV